MPEEIKLRFSVSQQDEGKRLDVFVSSHAKDISRNRIQKLIKSGFSVCSGTIVHDPDFRVKAGMEIEITIPPPQPVEIVPEKIELDIIYEDDDVLVINKPAGMVVHPAPGHAGGTLVNAILAHCPRIKGIGGELRPGIVHRLDKDTSGVMVVALNEFSMMKLAEQFKKGVVKKNYLAIVKGVPPLKGKIETLIGRSSANRKKMSAEPKRGRLAITEYQVMGKFTGFSLVSVKIKTGRTHQIRVHMSHIGHPVAGDSQYGRFSHRELPSFVKRQMLHSETIEIIHPRLGERKTFSAKLPRDFIDFLTFLKERKGK